MSFQPSMFYFLQPALHSKFVRHVKMSLQSLSWLEKTDIKRKVIGEVM